LTTDSRLDSKATHDEHSEVSRVIVPTK